VNAKTLNASYCLIGSRDQGVNLCLSQLALRGQRAHLISEAGEVDEGILGLACVSLALALSSLPTKPDWSFSFLKV
jgi:hypothetical protein